MSHKKSKRLSAVARARRDVCIEREMRLALARERDELVDILAAIYDLLQRRRSHHRFINRVDFSLRKSGTRRVNTQEEFHPIPSEQRGSHTHIGTIRPHPTSQV